MMFHALRVVTSAGMLLSSSAGQGMAAYLPDGKYLCITAQVAGVRPHSSPPYSGAMVFPEDHLKFLLSIAPNRLNPVSLKICAQAEEYWQGIAKEHEGYPGNSPLRTPEGRDVLDKTSITTMCLATSVATIRFYDSKHIWQYYANDMPWRSYEGTVAGNWLTLRDDGEFEAGETFDAQNVVAFGRCQLIPD